MHANDKVGEIEGTTGLGVSQVPDGTELVKGKLGLDKDILGLFAVNETLLG